MLTQQQIDLHIRALSLLGTINAMTTLINSEESSQDLRSFCIKHKVASLNEYADVMKQLTEPFISNDMLCQ